MNAKDSMDVAAKENLPSMSDIGAIEVEFVELLNSAIAHYFVAPNTNDPDVVEKLTNLDIDNRKPDSITQFLMLPTITTSANLRRKDLILDYTTSKNLMSKEYTRVVEQMQLIKEDIARAKERTRVKKEAAIWRKAEE